MEYFKYYYNYCSLCKMCTIVLRTIRVCTLLFTFYMTINTCQKIRRFSQH